MNHKLITINKTRVIIILVLFLFTGFSTINYGQESPKESKLGFDIGADIMSRYVWRGTQFGGSSPSIQPFTSLSIGNLEVGAWGAYSTGGINPYQEFDFYATYNFADEMFSATITDYFFPDDTSDYKYFKYGKDNTGHIFEGTLSFNGTKKIPVSLFIATNFYGCDAKKINDDVNSPDFNKEDGIQYSTYFELGYSTSIKEVDFDAFLGFTPNSPKKADVASGYIGENGFYGNSPGIVNLGFTATKEIKITDKYSLPISTSIITNPQAEKVYFVFGISL